MANELIISVSGLRGIVGDTLTPEVAERYAAAFAATLPPGAVLVTRDGRANGPQLVAPIVAGLSQNGARKVLDGGVAATPTTGVLVRANKCVGGIQISASHNPAPYNGMKLFSGEGRVVPGKVGEQVLRAYQRADAEGSRNSVASGGLEGEAVGDTTSAHLRLVEQIVDVDRVRAKRFRVVLDANHGSGSVLGRPLLERLGCEVKILGAGDGWKVRPRAGTDSGEFGVGIERRNGVQCGCRLLSGSRCGPTGDCGRDGQLHWRGIYAGVVRRPCSAKHAGARGDELLDESNDGGSGAASMACRFFVRRWARRT